MSSYPLDHFIADLEFVLAAAGSEAELLEGAAPLVARYATTPGWLEPAHRACRDGRPYGEVLLHQAPDGGLNISTGAWSPGGGVPPHDHGTWAIMAGVEGQETNTLWRRADDNSLEPGEVRPLSPGEVLCMPAGAIHSVVNAGDQVSVTLHVYGRDLTAGVRHQYDPQTGAASPLGNDFD